MLRLDWRGEKDSCRCTLLIRQRARDGRTRPLARDTWPGSALHREADQVGPRLGQRGTRTVVRRWQPMREPFARTTTQLDRGGLAECDASAARRSNGTGADTGRHDPRRCGAGAHGDSTTRTGSGRHGHGSDAGHCRQSHRLGRFTPGVARGRAHAAGRGHTNPSRRTTSRSGSRAACSDSGHATRSNTRRGASSTRHTACGSGRAHCGTSHRDAELSPCGITFSLDFRLCGAELRLTGAFDFVMDRLHHGRG